MKILIIGAGFAGMRTAFSLKKILKEDADIIVVDERRLHVFTPGLIGFVTDKIRKKEIVIDAKDKLEANGIRFLQGKLRRIDFSNKKAAIGSATLRYDFLVLSTGLETNHFGIKDIEKNSCGFKTLKDAEDLKKSISGHEGIKLELSIVGGGATGVQLASHLSGFIDHRQGSKVRIFSDKDRLLTESPRPVSEMAEKHLRKKGVDIFLNSKVTGIKDSMIRLASGEESESDMIIWAAGLKLADEMRSIGLECSSGGFYADRYFQAINHEDIFIAGDCIAFKGGSQPIKRAQNAHKQGKVVARNIANRIKGKKLAEYKAKEIPTIISLDGPSIFYYKNISLKSRMFSLLDFLIMKRHTLAYSTFLKKVVH